MSTQVFTTLAAGLRAWAEGDRINAAAVELLITHETWVRRADFRDAAMDTSEDMSRINWDAARSFADAGPIGSTTELAVLKLAVAIGSDEYRLASMGSANAGNILQAFATALRVGTISRG